MALRENMICDPEKDEYTCYAGRKLRVKHVGERRSESGFVSQITYYKCDDCSGCPTRKVAPGSRTTARSIFPRDSERITSEKGILLRMNRSIQSEVAFGVVKKDYGFLLR